MKLDKLVNRSLLQDSIVSDPSRPSDTAVGIEVEVENIPLGEVSRGYTHWDVVNEGSIHMGVEFVSRPVWGTGITAALNELQDILNKESPYVSFRTSVHVHINILDTTTDELCRIVQLYPLYERPFFRLHREWNRYDNIFCVPMTKSTNIQSGYARLLRDLEKGTLNGRYVEYKYSALNPNSIGTFGTLEFRHMGGTINVEEISRWINILLQFKLAAIEDRQPRTDPEVVFGQWSQYLDVRPDDIEAGLELEDYVLTLKESL